MELFEQVEKHLRWKKGAQYISDKLQVPLQEVEEAIREIKSGKSVEEEVDLEIEGQTQRYNLDRGTLEISAVYTHPPTAEELIISHKIDTKIYSLSSFYSKGHKNGTFTTTALFKKINQEVQQTNDFIEFLKTYKSDYKSIKRDKKVETLGQGALLLNKQDAHLNKQSLNGDNDIFERFEEYESLIDKTLCRASKLANIEKVVYIIGSDHFNSEVTGMTVKGTPQSNILNYQVSFELVCRHEVKVIDKLLQTSDNIEVIYLLGNHDACVSYHMASWLKVYYRDEDRVSIDINSDFTKYFSLFDTAIGINHGDVQKPERLVQNFPLEYKEGFGKANHHIFITGDRHTELTKDIGGVKFFQIPALSKARGSWDKQMGYTTTPAQMTSFLIEPNNGISIVFKETL